MNIIFRVDSSYQIGTGHLMRCMTLAEALCKRGNAITFICRELPGNCIHLLRENHFPVITLSYHEATKDSLLHLPEHRQWVGETSACDLDQTIALISRFKSIDWIVVDHYGLDIEWETACRRYTKNLMVIDDIADRHHDADILLDQNYHENHPLKYAHLVNSTCRLLLGPQYALLRAEFINARAQLKARNGTIHRIMVSLGGADPNNATQTILNGINQSLSKNLHIDVVLGSSNQHKSSIEAWCATKPNYHLHYQTNQMAELMLKADLAIGAGGTTTWERCCLGLPSLVVKIANNQDELIKQAASARILEYLGDIESLDTDSVARKLDALTAYPEKLRLMSQNAIQTVVDPRGLNRVIDELLSISYEENDL